MPYFIVRETCIEEKDSHIMRQCLVAPWHSPDGCEHHSGGAKVEPNLRVKPHGHQTLNSPLVRGLTLARLTPEIP